MAVQRTRYQGPSRAQRGGETIRQQVIAPVGGVNTWLPPHQLSMTEAQEALNVTLSPDRQGLVMRSRISSLHTQNAPSAIKPTQAFVARTVGDEDELLVVNAYLPGTDVYQLYSYNPTYAVWGNASAVSIGSQDTNGYFLDLAPFSDGTQTYFIIATDQGLYSKQISISTSGTLSVSNFGIDSNTSSARYVEAFDDRVVFFNTHSSATTDLRWGRRVQWSVRGSGTDFTSIGAGFQDLADMNGEGTGIVADGDRLVLFSERETWLARPRRDAFGFDFYRISEDVGCAYPRTLVRTEAGPIWVGRDLRVYRLVGTTPREVGLNIRRNLISQNPSTHSIYASYNPHQREYRLFVQPSSGTTTTAYTLKVDTISPARRAEGGVSLDRGVWHINDYFGGTERITASAGSWHVLSQGTVATERFEGEIDTALEAVGVTVNALWRSKGLVAADPSQKEAVSDVWVDLSDSVPNGFFSRPAIRVYDSNETNHVFAGSSASISSTTALQTVHIPTTPVALRHPSMRIAIGPNAHLHSMRLDLRSFTGRW